MKKINRIILLAILLVFAVFPSFANIVYEVTDKVYTEKIEQNGRAFTFVGDHWGETTPEKTLENKKLTKDVEMVTYAFTDDKMYLVPMGSSGINLMSTHYPTRDGYIGTTELEHNTNYNFESISKDSKIYTDSHILVIGGYADRPSNDGGSFRVGYRVNGEQYDWKTATVEKPEQISGEQLPFYLFRMALETGARLSISVSTDTGSMELVSQSNNAYRRPFELYLQTKYSNIEEGGGSNRSMGLVKIDSTNYEFYSDVYDPNKVYFPRGGNYVEAKGTSAGIIQEYIRGSSFFFDLIIALPGEFKQGTTILTYNNRDYILSEAEDYAAMITIKLKLLAGDDTVLAEKTITVPFTGYIDLAQASTTTSAETNASLVVIPDYKASVINLKKDQGQRIRVGSIDFMANYGNIVDDDTEYNRNIFAYPDGYTYNGIVTPPAEINIRTLQGIKIFLSSSKTPQTPGSLFMFERVGSKAEPNAYNSLGFTIEIDGDDGQRATYYGDEYWNNIGSNNETIVRQGDIPADVIVANKVDSSIGHSRHKKNDNDPSNLWKTYRYYEFSGDIYLNLFQSSADMMQAGRYVENVYVHVISEIEPDTSTGG